MLRKNAELIQCRAKTQSWHEISTKNYLAFTISLQTCLRLRRSSKLTDRVSIHSIGDLKVAIRCNNIKKKSVFIIKSDFHSPISGRRISYAKAFTAISCPFFQDSLQIWNNWVDGPKVGKLHRVSESRGCKIVKYLDQISDLSATESRTWKNYKVILKIKTELESAKIRRFGRVRNSMVRTPWHALHCSSVFTKTGGFINILLIVRPQFNVSISEEGTSLCMFSRYVPARERRYQFGAIHLERKQIPYSEFTLT